MQSYYSFKENTFFIDGVHESIPKDAIRVTEGEHLALVVACEQGKIIQADKNGYPVAVEPPVPPAPTEQELAQQRITEVQQQLTANDLASVRPLRAKLAGTATDFDDARLAELEAQAQALRTELVTLTTKLQEFSDQTTE